MLAKLQKLQEKLDELEKVSESIKIRKKDFEKELEKDLSDKKTLEEEISALKAGISPYALAEYEETGKKQLTGGLGIKVMKRKTYSEDEAFKYALETKTCLKLDKKAFEKVADALNLDIVTVTPENTVTFPAKLKLES